MTPRWVRGATLRPRYLAFGRGARRLARDLVFIPGMKGVAERMAITLGPSFTLTDGAPLEAWRAIADALAPRAAFLLWTGWYKETALVGVVAPANGAPLFVKLFADPAIAAAEAARAEIAAAIVGPVFRPAALRRHDGRLVAYQLLAHGRTKPGAAEVRQAAMTLCGSTLAASDETAPAHAFVDPGVAERIAATGHAPAPPAWIDETPVSRARCHGDLTPWNIFRDTAGALCLIDYERVGIAAPYNDAFHLALQPAALAGDGAVAAPTIRVVADHAGVSHATAARWCALYLLRELDRDTREWTEQGRRHHQLATLIRTKAAMLDAVRGQIA